MLIPILTVIASLALLAPFIFWSFLNFSSTLDNLVTNKWKTISLIAIISFAVLLVCIAGILLVVFL